MIRTGSCADPTWDINLALGQINGLARQASTRCYSDPREVSEQASMLTRCLNRVHEFCRDNSTDLRREWCVGRMRDAELLAGFAHATIRSINVGSPAARADLALARRAARRLAIKLATAQRDALSRFETAFEAAMAISAPGQKLAVSVDPQPDPVPVLGRPPRQRVEPSASAGRLLSAATRLLPPCERDRYAREFESELWDLAAQGASRGEQVTYGLRQAVRVPELRGIARSPPSRSATP